MSDSQLVGLTVAAWSLLTLGVYMLTHSAAVVPLSAGIAVSIIAGIFWRQAYVAELDKKDEAGK